jgi:hypothetical protein
LKEATSLGILAFSFRSNMFNAGKQGGNMEFKHITLPSQELAPDLLRGADKIADFLFGDMGQRRKVYHLAETSWLPVFRLGSLLCARRSILLAWIAEQEQRGCGKTG